MPPDQFDVFLSYHWRDQAQVEVLARRLQQQNRIVFLDRWYLTPGLSWPKELEATLARCRAVAVCIGQGEMGPWQQREWDLALERQVAAERRGQSFPVIPVLLPGSEPPHGFLSQHTWVDFREGSDDRSCSTHLSAPLMVNRQGRTYKRRSVIRSPPFAPTGACSISEKKTHRSFSVVQRPSSSSSAPFKTAAWSQ